MTGASWVMVMLLSSNHYGSYIIPHKSSTSLLLIGLVFLSEARRAIENTHGHTNKVQRVIMVSCLLCLTGVMWAFYFTSEELSSSWISLTTFFLLVYGTTFEWEEIREKNKLFQIIEFVWIGAVGIASIASAIYSFIHDETGETIHFYLAV